MKNEQIFKFTAIFLYPPIYHFRDLSVPLIDSKITNISNPGVPKSEVKQKCYHRKKN